MEAPRISESIGADLAPFGCQFALARPIFDLPPADPVDSSTQEPFGMRFFLHTEKVGEFIPPRFRYDDEHQLAVTDDESATPLITLPASPEKTTTGHSDGKNPRGEEFRIDFAGDHRQ
jgi:hypothetical protein